MVGETEVIEPKEDSKSTAASDNSAIDERHCNSLNKEQKKAKPNKSVINKYLNVEFSSRRRKLQAGNQVDRARMIFENYPCFKDPCEVCAAEDA